MPDFITDLVGFAGTREYRQVSAADATTSRDNITDAMVAAMVAAGWTVLSGPTATTFGDEYELYSAQSPWYDQNNIPSWYLGGRAYVKFTHPNSTFMNVFVGEYYNSTIQNEMSGADVITLNMIYYKTAGREFSVLANPYEVYIWPATTVTESVANVYIGALNIPKELQQGQRAISCIMSTRLRSEGTTLQGTQKLYSCWRDLSGSQSFFISTSIPKVYFLNVKSGTPFTGDGRGHGRRIWQRANDADMSDMTQWWPFFCPAQVAFPIGSSSNTPTFNGFLWDSVVITDAFELQSTIRMVNKEFVNMAGSTAATDSTPAALFVNFGPAGATL